MGLLFPFVFVLCTLNRSLSLCLHLHIRVLLSPFLSLTLFFFSSSSLFTQYNTSYTWISISAIRSLIACLIVHTSNIWIFICHHNFPHEYLYLLCVVFHNQPFTMLFLPLLKYFKFRKEFASINRVKPNQQHPHSMHAYNLQYLWNYREKFQWILNEMNDCSSFHLDAHIRKKKT